MVVIIVVIVAVIALGVAAILMGGVHHIVQALQPTVTQRELSDMGSALRRVLDELFGSFVLIARASGHETTTPNLSAASAANLALHLRVSTGRQAESALRR